MITFLFEVNLGRAISVVQKASTNLSAYLYRDILCPAKRSIQEAIEGSRLASYNAARRGLCQCKADARTEWGYVRWQQRAGTRFITAVRRPLRSASSKVETTD